ncbi:hypothetical protein ACJIZ3_025537 [Penstemon smallii]|uniref:RING-type domain-containing protein n=1 Tax=Penstemon smallii TaxID=265156 RepID=A0ABD3TWK6_9LAMI
MPKDRRVSSLSIDRAMVSPYSCSLKNSDSNNSEKSFVGDKREWEEARCPICIEHPHNAVLLICSSREKGCRPFMCDTSYRHSNCLDQFHKSSSAESELVCPLCRGSISGCIVIDKARRFMDSKTRSCSLETCNFSGNYSELRKHARVEHPYSCPSMASPTRQSSWTALEQQNDIQDALAHQFVDDDYDWSGLDEDGLLSDDSFFDFQMSDIEEEFEDMFNFGGGVSTSFFSLYLSSLEEEEEEETLFSGGISTSGVSEDTLQRRRLNLTNSSSRSNNALRYHQRERSRSNNNRISRQPSNRANPRSRPSYYQDNNVETSSRTRWVHDREIGGGSYSRTRLSHDMDNATPASSRTSGPGHHHWGDVHPNLTGARYINGRRVVHAIREFPDDFTRQQPHN